MGVIYYKNQQYASGSGAPGSSSEHIELTYAEYQALSEAEQKNGAIYFITDVDNDGGIIGYIGGTGITVSEDKVIAIKDIKKNYIDNSNFRINTRGQSEYTTSDSSIYTVDRWYIDGGILTPVENGVQFTNTNTSAGSSSLIRLKQDIPYTFADLAGKTLTLSAKINGTIYKGSATLPSEKPTEGTAIQYIAVGIPAFGINLNYSITGDYFVPYLALAYTQSVLVEWMKLEVNDEFSGYVEPDYQTEKIKLSYMSDSGKVNMHNTWTYIGSVTGGGKTVSIKGYNDIHVIFDNTEQTTVRGINMTLPNVGADFPHTVRKTGFSQGLETEDVQALIQIYLDYANQTVALSQYGAYANGTNITSTTTMYVYGR